MIEPNKIYYNNNGELAIFFSEEVIKKVKDKMCKPITIKYKAIHNSNDMFEYFELSKHSFINRNENGTLSLFDRESKCSIPVTVAVFSSEWSITRKNEAKDKKPQEFTIKPLICNYDENLKEIEKVFAVDDKYLLVQDSKGNYWSNESGDFKNIHKADD